MKMQVYKALADCYFQPDEQLSAAVVTLEHVLQEWIPEQAEQVQYMHQELNRDGKDLQNLTQEYSRLFVGPFELLAPPFGSVYFQQKGQQPQVMSDSTLDAEEFYRQAGLNLSQGFNSPPDHISAELEFMYFLLYKEDQALQKDDPSLALEYSNLRTSFLQKHLGLWGPVFAHRVTKTSSSEFYKSLGQITHAVIHQDKQDSGVERMPR